MQFEIVCVSMFSQCYGLRGLRWFTTGGPSVANKDQQSTDLVIAVCGPIETLVGCFIEQVLYYMSFHALFQ